jgi:hypothetical protein
VTTATHIRPVPADLPVYPIGAQDRLDGNSFVKWNSARWMASRTAKLMSWDQQGMHRYLFDACQMETPVGTLPDDDRELAAMLRTDAARIREIRGMEFGALRNWRPCLCDGQVRLMHHGGAGTGAGRAGAPRHGRAVQRGPRPGRCACDRLAQGPVRAEGLSADAVADPALIERMDEWMRDAQPQGPPHRRRLSVGPAARRASIAGTSAPNVNWRTLKAPQCATVQTQ